MKQFTAGFVACYLLGAIPFGLLLARMDKSAWVVGYGAAVWPSKLFEVAIRAKVEHLD